MSRLREWAIMGWQLFKIASRLLYESKGMEDTFFAGIADREIAKIERIGISPSPFQKYKKAKRRCRNQYRRDRRTS